MCKSIVYSLTPAFSQSVRQSTLILSQSVRQLIPEEIESTTAVVQLSRRVYDLFYIFWSRVFSRLYTLGRRVECAIDIDDLLDYLPLTTEMHSCVNLAAYLCAR